MKRIIFISLILTSLLVSFCACGHEHSYEQAWSYDESHHWHQTTCSHGEGERSAHIFVELSSTTSICSVCGYEIINDDTTSFLDYTNEYEIESGICDINIENISGTEGAYTIENNILTFSGLNEDSVYSISGKLDGSIIIDIGDEYKLDLELCGFSLSSTTTNPITILSGDKISITAKKDTENSIYDGREAIDEDDGSLYSGAIHSEADLEICGNGALTVLSSFNNGIHSKDDLEIKNLTLNVSCSDNALKGNDEVVIKNANVTLISTKGDAIKTSNSDVSSNGKQRGNITITDSTVAIYSACDGIDASHNVIIEGESSSLNIYTAKYSKFSEDADADEEELEDSRYIRFTSDKYYYSIKYYNSDDDYKWVNAEYYKSVSGGRTTYYYYSLPILEGYSQFKFFLYDSANLQGQENDYLVSSDYISWNKEYDTFALSSRGGSLSYNWTNYSSTITDMGGFGGPGGFGGMSEGNSDKSELSAKGIKANNEIIVNDGSIYIKAYDDAIHAKNDEALENGVAPLGNLTINGGNLVIYASDDGLHADGTLSITDGNISIIQAYEGIEGYTVSISGGAISVTSSDDGINSTATSGTAISICGGYIYIYSKGDGIDANTRTSYEGIIFTGGNTVVICNSNGNSALDTEQGYTYNDGYVIAINTAGGMSSETEHGYNFQSYASTKALSLSQEEYLVIDNGEILTLKMPASISNAKVVFLGDSSADISTSEKTDCALDQNGVCWN